MAKSQAQITAEKVLAALHASGGEWEEEPVPDAAPVEISIEGTPVEVTVEGKTVE